MFNVRPNADGFGFSYQFMRILSRFLCKPSSALSLPSSHRSSTLGQPSLCRTLGPAGRFLHSVLCGSGWLFSPEASSIHSAATFYGLPNPPTELLMPVTEFSVLEFSFHSYSFQLSVWSYLISCVY